MVQVEELVGCMCLCVTDQTITFEIKDSVGCWMFGTLVQHDDAQVMFDGKGYSTNSQIHTHPFNGPLSRTTQVSRYQKGNQSGFY